MDIDFGYVKEYVSNFDQVKSDIVEVAKNCFNFSGNLSRPKYLSYSVALWLVSMVVNGVLAPLSSRSMIFGLLMGLFSLAFAVVTIGPLVCRVRDSGKNIWVTLLCIFPGIILCGLPTLYSLYVVVLVGSHNGAPSAPAAQPQDQPPAGN
jgi:uncharacterized membrane protein YhaH (DUF805 family)